MNPYLESGLSRGPEIIATLLAQIPASRYDEAEPDRFTIREVIAHMADVETMFRTRITAGRDAPGSSVELWDEDQRAIDLDYASQPVEASLEKWRSERKVTKQLIFSLSDSEMEGWVSHPTSGRQTIVDLITFILGHDLYHIDQIAGYLRS